MQNQLISIKEYCIHYKAEPSFIEELEELGLIKIQEQENEKFIEEEQLSALESYHRMFYELEINLAGIDAIHHLLNRMHRLQNEMTELRNQLRFYEL